MNETILDIKMRDWSKAIDFIRHKFAIQVNN